jgi:hypothetical protein
LYLKTVTFVKKKSRIRFENKDLKMIIDIHKPHAQPIKEIVLKDI